MSLRHGQHASSALAAFSNRRTNASLILSSAPAAAVVTGCLLPVTGTRLSYVMAHQVFQAASRAIPSHPTPLVALARLQEHCHEHPSYDPLVQGAAELETLRALHLNVSELENMDQDDLWLSLIHI